MNIRPKDRDALIQALRAGVVPRVGQHLIQVGRIKEIEALIKDIERIGDGGSCFRVVVGQYGAGKTFFINLVKTIANEKKVVTVNADLNPDRRLHASGGQARSLYSELIKNMATRTKPDGNALPGVVEKFIGAVRAEAKETGVSTDVAIRDKLSHLNEMVNGYDFSEVIAAYWKATEDGNDQLKQDALRWLRGEFSTKTEARQALGVRSCIDDADVYDQLKLMAKFVRLAGFDGLLVCLDEMVNLYKLSNTQARNANYEQILRILNDSLQGGTEGLGFILGGTPEFLTDSRRGLYSYAALQSRLAENTFAKGGLVDYSGPVLTLASLTPEDFYVLLYKLREVFAYGDARKIILPDEALPAFMAHCQQKLGESYFRTPRTTITSFVNFLSVLEQNPDVKWDSLIQQVKVEEDNGGKAEHELEVDDELSTFQL